MRTARPSSCGNHDAEGTMSDERERLSANMNADDEVEAHARSWQNTNEDVADDVEGHRLGQGAWNNTNESVADDREKLASNTNESLADDRERLAGNTNESLDDEVEAHMRRLPPTA
jgi:hypothetical protein